MNNVDILNNFCKMFVIYMYTYYIFIKILNYHNNNLINKIMMMIASVFFAIIDVMCMKYINPAFIIPITYSLYSVIIKYVIKEKFNYCFIVINISFVITYLVYLLSVVFTEIILYIVNPSINYKNPINIIIIASIMIFIFYVFGKIKRFKNGVNFLSNKNNMNKEYKIISILYFISFIILGLLNRYDNIFLNYFLEWVILIMVTVIIYWIRSQITKHYKKDMKDRTIEIQKLEIDEKEKIIEDIKTENLKLAEVVHKYNNRLSAIEMAMEEAINKNMNTEIAKELSIVLDETKELATSFARESTVAVNSLPLTNIAGIDNMFKYMQKEAIKNNISFDLKLNNSIQSLIENIISKDKFETMLGDHIRDAIIAINYSKNKYRNILVTLGIVENFYELSIYDTGIEFKIETLLNLGRERITTHKESGGNGIGFMTTFETLRKAKASLIIEEYNPKDSSYTKSVNIRFDGKNQYSIYSYRAKEIKNLNKYKKIVIKEL